MSILITETMEVTRDLEIVDEGNGQVFKYFPEDSVQLLSVDFENKVARVACGAAKRACDIDLTTLLQHAKASKSGSVSV